jgi:serine/threonine protein kinase
VAPPPSIDLAGCTLASELAPGVCYRIDGALGEGGTAVTFLALRCEGASETPVVIKVMQPHIVAEAGAKAALLVRKEVVALGRINEVVPPCPFVVRFIDTGTVRTSTRAGELDLPWIALEYVHGGVEGTSLEERVRFSVDKTGLAFDRERAARALRHVCVGLGEAHAAGVIHRDLCPGNVLCTGWGREEIFKISDFGIARPVGIAATFGPTVLGTPGYMPPEQLDAGELTVQADVFALGSLAFFVLTGEHYFTANNAMAALAQAAVPARRSVRDARTLAPELASDTERCAAIDLLLSSATSVERTRRPASAEAFASAILPLVEPVEEACVSVASQRLAVAMKAARPPSPSAASWAMVCPPDADRVVRAVDWESEGHALSCTNRGLEFYNGAQWVLVPGQDTLPFERAPRFVAYAGTGRWVVGGDDATLVDYSRHGVAWVIRCPSRDVTLERARGDLDGVLVAVGRDAGNRTLLCAHAARHWFKPLPLDGVAAILSLARLDDERWVVAGRSSGGQGVVGVYRPFHWEVAWLAVAPSRAYLAVASRPEWGAACAVGADGAVVHIDASGVRSYGLEGASDLCAASMDPLGRTWAGAAGELWVDLGDGRWLEAWRDPSWQTPFVSIHADVGLVTAITADGAALQSRMTRREARAPALG